METRAQEGKVAKAIERHTAEAPTDIFLWSAISVMGVSLCFKLCRKDHMALFIDQWAAPFLLLGLYNKIVKVAGSDRTDKS